MEIPPLHFVGAVLNAIDPEELASFYERLLGWSRFMDETDWIAIRHANGGTALAFQPDPDVVRPTWPPESGRQQVQLHLDFTTDDLDAAVQHALEAGATLATVQPSESERVLIDPAGNPFCLIASNG